MSQKLLWNINEVNNLNTNFGRDLIKQIQNITGRKLISYAVNFNSPFSAIGVGDVIPFADMLHSLGSCENLDFMISSPGGDLNTAEKIVDMFRKNCTNLRAIVPNIAKSAATIITLASDEIIMGPTSDLGPIDPQIPVIIGGNPHFVSVQSYIDGLVDLNDQVKSGKIHPSLAAGLVSRTDVATYDACLKLKTASIEIAKKWLSNYMYKGNKRKAAYIARTLADAKKFPTHGKVITAKDAKALGLKITELQDGNNLWSLIFKLHVWEDYAITTRGCLNYGKVSLIYFNNNYLQPGNNFI